MRTLLLPALLLLSTATAFAADDLRTFTETDMADLSGRIGKDLRKCKELKHGAQANLTFRNKTEESIDGDAFKKAIQAQLTPSGGGPGKAYDLFVQLSSRTKQTGQNYSGTYTLKVDVMQAEEVLCSKTETLVKSGTIPVHP